jgi:hypothetical protein
MYVRKIKNAYNIWLSKSERMRLLGRLKQKCEDNIKWIVMTQVKM